MLVRQLMLATELKHNGREIELSCCEVSCGLYGWYAHVSMVTKSPDDRPGCKHSDQVDTEIATVIMLGRRDVVDCP